MQFLDKISLLPYCGHAVSTFLVACSVRRPVLLWWTREAPSHSLSVEIIGLSGSRLSPVWLSARSCSAQPKSECRLLGLFLLVWSCCATSGRLQARRSDAALSNRVRQTTYCSPLWLGAKTFVLHDLACPHPSVFLWFTTSDYVLK